MFINRGMNFKTRIISLIYYVKNTIFWCAKFSKKTLQSTINNSRELRTPVSSNVSFKSLAMLQISVLFFVIITKYSIWWKPMSTIKTVKRHLYSNLKIVYYEEGFYNEKNVQWQN